MTVAGHEIRGKELIYSLAEGYFDSVECDSLGSFLLVKKCGKENAPRVLIDAHFDTVGMMVTDIKKGGFLKVVNVGGLDTRVLPATEVTVYGKKEIYGLVASTPPHLSRGGADVPKIDELMIDTGISDKEELERIVSIGDAVGYRTVITKIEGNTILSPSLDDKACVCAALEAVYTLNPEEMECDLYISVSAQEETGRNGGAILSFGVRPDIAIIVDVNFSRDHKDDCESLEMGKGAGIDISAMTDRRLTKNILAMLKREGIAHQTVCEPDHTGTNNEGILISKEGVRTAVISVPLRSMHTPCEAVCLDDIASLANILRAIVCHREVLI